MNVYRVYWHTFVGLDPWDLGQVADELRAQGYEVLKEEQSCMYHRSNGIEICDGIFVCGQLLLPKPTPLWKKLWPL